MSEGHENVLDMLCSALEMANQGKTLYEKALAACENTLSSEIFNILRDQEINHEILIREIYESLKTGKEFSEAWASCTIGHGSRTPIFDRLAEKYPPANVCVSETEALDIAVAFESACVDFYHQQLNRATNPLERQFVEAMLREERGHHRLLSDMQLYFIDPQGWFLLKERPSLDGE
jgi:rubrerythrin